MHWREKGSWKRRDLSEILTQIVHVRRHPPHCSTPFCLVYNLSALSVHVSLCLSIAAPVCGASSCVSLGKPSTMFLTRIPRQHTWKTSLSTGSIESAKRFESCTRNPNLARAWRRRGRASCLRLINDIAPISVMHVTNAQSREWVAGVNVKLSSSCLERRINLRAHFFPPLPSTPPPFHRHHAVLSYS